MLHNSGVHFPEDVAENEALRENIFMMVSLESFLFYFCSTLQIVAENLFGQFLNFFS
jgi:hypothetical protein